MVKHPSITGKLLRAYLLLFLFSGLWLSGWGCASNADDSDDDLQLRFDRGKAFLEKKKYLRAQEEFNYVVVSGSHTDLGDDAQFYLAEAYFLNKEYILAIAEYDRLVRRMGFSPYVEKARWRICQSYMEESPKYYHDQEYTRKALEKLQEFIEDYPQSEYREEALKKVAQLRNKLAKKIYETSLLYIKMEEYKSAIITLEDLINTYYDTDYIGLAHVEVVRCYSLLNEIEEAENYYQKVEPILKEKDLAEKARYWITRAQQRQNKGS